MIRTGDVVTSSGGRFYRVLPSGPKRYNLAPLGVGRRTTARDVRLVRSAELDRASAFIRKAERMEREDRPEVANACRHAAIAWTMKAADRGDDTAALIAAVRSQIKEA
jgi:hypothetical protein